MIQLFDSDTRIVSFSNWDSTLIDEMAVIETGVYLKERKKSGKE